MQARIGEVAKRLVGIDCDRQAVGLLQAAGVQSLVVGDLDSLSTLPFSPDVIVFGETIEHLSNVGSALENLKRLMSPDTRLLISTPNLVSLYYLYQVFRKRETHHNGHRVGFTYGLLVQLLNSYDLEVEDFYFTFLNRPTDDFKKVIWKSISRYFKGFSETLLAVCKLKNG